MKKIYMDKGVLMYYGNPAGYLAGKTVILDSLFVKEEVLGFVKEREGLAVEVRNGVFDRLAEGGRVETDIPAERRVRIYQLKQDSPFQTRFVSLAERERRGFGEPKESDYEAVYEKEVETFNLDGIWDSFAKCVPDDFKGRALSISDVIEFTDKKASRFFYVEPGGFREIIFREEEER